MIDSKLSLIALEHCANLNMVRSYADLQRQLLPDKLIARTPIEASPAMIAAAFHLPDECRFSIKAEVYKEYMKAHMEDVL